MGSDVFVEVYPENSLTEEEEMDYCVKIGRYITCDIEICEDVGKCPYAPEGFNFENGGCV